MRWARRCSRGARRCSDLAKLDSDDVRWHGRAFRRASEAYPSRFGCRGLWKLQRRWRMVKRFIHDSRLPGWDVKFCASEDGPLEPRSGFALLRCMS